MKLSKLKINPNNPQVFDDLTKLENSIRDFPKMMSLRKLVYDPKNMQVLGGNKRLICLQNLGFKEIPDNWTVSADELTEDEKKRFIIADNIGFGEWDFNILETEFNDCDIGGWGLDVEDLDIDEVEEVEAFNEYVNFQIVCDNIGQFEELQTKFNISSKKIKYNDFLLKISL